MFKKTTISLVASFLLATNSLQANEDYKLSPITVTSATKVKQSIKDVTSNVSVITAQEIELRKYATIVDALNSITGFSFTSNGGVGSTSSISLRGNENERLLVLIDGIKYKDHYSLSGADLSQITLNNIERIEIVKGAQSGIWGADASAGVINIITKGAKKGFSGNFFTHFGSFNTKNYGTTLSYGADSFDVLLSANILETDSFTSYAPNGEDIDQFEDDAYENTTLSFKTNYYINSYSKVGFSILDTQSEKDFDAGWPTNPNDNTMVGEINNRLYNLYYNVELKNHNINVKYNHSEYEIDSFITKGISPKYNETTTQSFEINDTITYNEDDFVIIGASLTKDKLDLVDENRDNESRNFYLTNSNQFGDLILTQSIRYDDYDNFSNETTGKIGAKYFITSDFSVSSNYGTSYRVPSIFQNVNPWGASNLNIKPEEGRSFDIGFEYKGFSATYFYQKVDNLIEWFDPDFSVWGDEFYTNLDGESTLKGIEVEYKKDILEDTFLSLGYTRLSAKDKNDNDLSNKAKNSFKFGVDYYGISNLSVSVFGEYVGTRYDGVTNRQTGRYTLWNTTLNYEINENLSMYVKVDNIFDKYYQTVDGYATAPRSAYVGLKASF